MDVGVEHNLNIFLKHVTLLAQNKENTNRSFCYEKNSVFKKKTFVYVYI